jgi:ATP-dependent Clp protease ATP-binding subunit ClpA
MFQRYTPSSRRAIFFARETAMTTGASVINSEHILLGLLVGEDFRANTLFHLRELLPVHAASQSNLKHHPVGGKEPPLSKDGKRALAYSAEEASLLEDYWIDTDHLVLGILRERGCAGAEILAHVGIQIETARQIVASNKTSRPDLGRSPVLWWARPVGRFAILAGLLYLLGVIYLFEVLTNK